MGFESFQVELRGEVQDPGHFNRFIRGLPNVKPDTNAMETSGSDYFIVDDGAHKMELEVTESRGLISCRFTLCHPPSIDAAFVSLIREFVERLRMKVRICAVDTSRWYSSEDLPEFVRDVDDCIATERRGWIAQFGPVQLAATTAEAFEKIVLPQCEPLHGPFN